MLPAARNNRRYDLSDRLIHFFRAVDLASDDAPITPQEWGFSSVPEDTDMPALYMLRHCIRQGRIWATWSERGGSRTIYGPRAAVCFTEMPIAAFVEASRSRSRRGEAIAPYALVLAKQEAARVGAMPVIYGICSDARARVDAATGQRMLPGDALPPREQFRYVVTDPATGRPDWTHEREWRWPCDARPWFDADGIPPGGSGDIPGLELDAPNLRGIGVIVPTRKEAELVAYDVLTKVDRGDVASDHYQFVLALDAFPDWTELRGVGEIEEAIHDNLLDLGGYFAATRRDADGAAAEVDGRAREQEAATPIGLGDFHHEYGGCWLWLRDNRHPLVRALLRGGRVVVTRLGHYLMDLDRIDPTRPLQQRQVMVDAIAQSLFRDFGLPGTYYAVRGSWDPNAIPSFHDDALSDDFFWNSSFSG